MIIGEAFRHGNFGGDEEAKASADHWSISSRSCVFHRSESGSPGNPMTYSQGGNH
jgi:hypothetical protein